MASETEITEHLTYSGKSFDEVDHFVNSDGLYIRSKHWPVEESPKFLLHIMHGFGSHSCRFEEAALRLNEVGGHVFSHDQVGHGESEGERANIDDYQIYVRDSLQLIEATTKRFPGVPVFIMGQSMGAALAVVVANEKPSLIRGVILLAGMLGPDPRITSFKRKFLQLASFVLPRFTIITMSEDDESKPSQQVVELDNDPLKCRRLKTRMLMQLTCLAEKVVDLRTSFDVPFLAMHGTMDTTCDSTLSKLFYEESPCSDKTFRLYPGCQHDLIHEGLSDRTKCYNDIFAWIGERSGS